MIALLARASLVHLSACGWLCLSSLSPLRNQGYLNILFIHAALLCLTILNVLRTACTMLHAVVRPELAFTFLRSLPGVRRIVERSKRQILLELEVSLKSGAKEQKICELPTSGLSVEDILKTAARLKNGDYKQLFYASKLTGTIYASDTRHRDLCNTVYCDFAHTNPLHSDAFPSVGRMELEIVHMTSRLLSSDSRIEICGTVTSGGTESILTAIRASRDFICHTKGITNPEMIVSLSAHAAVYKAAEYFKIKIRRVPMDENGRMNILAVKKALRRQTVLVYASAPTYPHGTIDPVDDLSNIALQHGCCLHVDACLGGFVLPFLSDVEHESRVPKFDFSLPGVTSMSVDTHKYGYAQKGSSVILYSTAIMRQFQYTSVADWSGGLYISPTPAGSRSGGLIAQTWAAMLHMGYEGYSKAAHDIFAGAKKLREAIAATEGLELIGTHITMIVAWHTSTGSNIYVLNDILTSKGWRLAVLQNPKALHFCITPANLSAIDELITDLRSAVRLSQTLKTVPGGKAPIYGLAHGLPDRGVIKALLKDVQDVMLNNM